MKPRENELDWKDPRLGLLKVFLQQWSPMHVLLNLKRSEVHTSHRERNMNVIVTVHSSSMQTLVWAFVRHWKVLESWQTAEENPNEILDWCEYCGLACGCTSKHMGEQFCRETSLLILRVIDRGNRTTGYISLGTWVIGDPSFLPLCCHYASLLHHPLVQQTSIHAVFTLWWCRVPLRTRRWPFCGDGRWLLEMGCLAMACCLAWRFLASLSTLYLHLIMYEFLLRTLCSVCSFDWWLRILQITLNGRSTCGRFFLFGC